MAPEVSGGGTATVRGAKGAAGDVGISGGGGTGDVPPPATADETAEYLAEHNALPEDLATALNLRAEAAADAVFDRYGLSAKERDHRKRRRKMARASRQKGRRR